MPNAPEKPGIAAATGTVLKGCLGLVFALAALFVAVAVLVAIFGGGKTAGTTGPTESPALVTTSTPTETTETTPVVEARPQVFRGNGDENLGTISVSVPSTLHWSCGACNVFGASAISTSGTESISVDSSEHTGGVTAVEPGTYHSVEVIANETEPASGWTIRITPGQNGE